MATFSFTQTLNGTMAKLSFVQALSNVEMFGVPPHKRADIAEGLLTKLNRCINDCDENIGIYNVFFVDQLVTRKTNGVDEEKDFTLTYCELQTKLAKAEKNLWVALKNLNWVLTDPFRKKMRDTADELMEHLEFGIQKGFVEEIDYINRSNEFAETLRDTEKVSDTMKMWFAIIPVDHAKLNEWRRRR
jgi:hypothetical protein